MKLRTFASLVVSLFAALVLPVAAEVVYTPVNVELATNGSYDIDLTHDGTTDFVLQSHLLQVYCQFGDGIVWYVAVQPGQSNGRVLSVGQNPLPLKIGAFVGSSQLYYSGSELMTEFAHGNCGNLVAGNWLNLPDRFLGLEFQTQGSNGPETHYGWAKVTVAGYLDEHGDLQTMTLLSSFAYETVPGKAIAAGQQQ
jgi:hypothetical protein